MPEISHVKIKTLKTTPVRKVVAFQLSRLTARYLARNVLALPCRASTFRVDDSSIIGIAAGACVFIENSSA
jgi:hypothetical protein